MKRYRALRRKRLVAPRVTQNRRELTAKSASRVLTRA